MERSTIVLITLVVYQLILIAIGFWAQRRTKDNEDFFLGGRQLGAIVASISYAASNSSAWTLIGFSGAAYIIGIPAFWFLPGILLGHYVSWKWVAPRVMHLSLDKTHLTITDLIAGDTNGGIRGAIVLTAAFMIIFSFTFYVSSQFHAAGLTFSENFPLSFEWSVAIGAGIVLIYTLLGGFWAVSVTDTLQGLLMAAVAVVLPVLALIAVGGFGPLFETLGTTLSSSQLALTGDRVAIAFVGFALGLAGLGIGAFGQPHLITRFMALKDDKALRRGRVIAMTWFTLVFIAMYIVGLCAHILLPPLDNPESLFFALTNDLMPGILAGVVSAAVLSAIMSTADSQLLVAASAVSHDLGLEKRFGVSPIVVSRVVISLLCAVAVFVTYQLPSDVFSRAAFAWSSLGNAFGPVVIPRAMGLNPKPQAVLAAIVLGFATTVYVHFNLAPGDIKNIFERIVPFVLASAVLLCFARGRVPVGKPAKA